MVIELKHFPPHPPSRGFDSENKSTLLFRSFSFIWRKQHHGWIVSKSTLIIICAQLCPTLCDTRDYSPPGPSVHGIFPSKNTGVDCHVLLHVIFPIRGSKLPDPGIEPMSPVSPALQADSLLLRHLGSPSLTSILIAISTHYVGELIIVWCCKQWINNSKQTDC